MFYCFVNLWVSPKNSTGVEKSPTGIFCGATREGLLRVGHRDGCSAVGQSERAAADGEGAGTVNVV